MTADLIILKDLSFFGYHGVLPEEAALGQRFVLDLEITLDLGRAAQTDDVADTVSYAEVYATLKSAVEDNRFKLLEALADFCIAQLFAGFAKIEAVVIRVRKPGAPIPMVVGEVAVQLSRRRHG